jgi:CheY-like chemotaxis protein
MFGRMLGSTIKVELQLEAKDARIEVDPTQLEMALLNAAVNARDAMSNGGALNVTLSDCELDGQAAVCISIADTGAGISRADLARVFEPFFTTKEIGKGTGLGLSQIHGFGEQAGGRVTIDSVEGTGTTLTIVLPRTGKRLPDSKKEAKTIALPRGLKVLLVEDNLQVRDFAADLLEDLNCDVVTATDAAEALEELKSRPFDIVFTDVVMPGMSGLQLADVIADRHPGLPVLLATGFSQSLVGGPVSYAVVSKPYDMGSLAKAISELLNQHQGAPAD